MRIQKFLSQKGICSRREAERLIISGQVKLNHKKAVLGDQVQAGDILHLDHKQIPVQLEEKKLEILRYYKPLGEVCSRDAQQFDSTVFDRLPRNEPWFLVGRLDVNTTGLLLITNSGDVAHRLMHAKFAHERVYELKCSKQLTDYDIKRLKNGIELSDGMAAFRSIELMKKYHYKVSLHQGRHRIVRRMIKAVDAHVAKLHRTQFAGVKLSRFQKPGEFSPLTDGGVKRLLDRVEKH